MKGYEIDSWRDRRPAPYYPSVSSSYGRIGFCILFLMLLAFSINSRIANRIITEWLPSVAQGDHYTIKQISHMPSTLSLACPTRQWQFVNRSSWSSFETWKFHEITDTDVTHTCSVTEFCSSFAGASVSTLPRSYVVDGDVTHWRTIILHGT